MDQSEHRDLSLPSRVRLTFALVVMAALVVLCAVGIGVTIHGWSETRDSLHHWQSRLSEDAAEPERAAHRTGNDSPKVRISRLQAELDTVPERLFAMGSVFLLASILLVLGYRMLRSR